jgi:flagellar FliL protein
MSDSAVVPAGPAARGSLKRSVMELAIVVLMSAAAGAAFEAYRPAPASGADRAAGPANVVAPPPASILYDLPAIVTNLGAPHDTWIRLEGSIVFDPKALPHPEVMAGQISDDILAYLRTVSLRQIEGPIGLEDIRQDLNERAATRSGGTVRELVIRTLVVQ